MLITSFYHVLMSAVTSCQGPPHDRIERQLTVIISLQLLVLLILLSRGAHI